MLKGLIMKILWTNNYFLFIHSMHFQLILFLYPTVYLCVLHLFSNRYNKSPLSGAVNLFLLKLCSLWLWCSPFLLPQTSGSVETFCFNWLNGFKPEKKIQERPPHCLILNKHQLHVLLDTLVSCLFLETLLLKSVAKCS